MAIANRDLICTSCGDTIELGKRVVILERTDKKGKDLLCFRCHPPETETAKVRINVRGVSIYQKTGRLSSSRY